MEDVMEFFNILYIIISNDEKSKDNIIKIELTE